MRHAMQHRITFAGTLLVALLWPLAVQASSQLASDKGCYNCHGVNLRGDAPSFERLASRLSRYKADPNPDAEQKWVDKFRAGESFQHIDAHERLTPESARALVHWLVEGGK
jgi:cytochrome c551/c552